MGPVAYQTVETMSNEALEHPRNLMPEVRGRLRTHTIQKNSLIKIYFTQTILQERLEQKQ